MDAAIVQRIVINVKNMINQLLLVSKLIVYYGNNLNFYLLQLGQNASQQINKVKQQKHNASRYNIDQEASTSNPVCTSYHQEGHNSARSNLCANHKLTKAQEVYGLLDENESVTRKIYIIVHRQLKSVSIYIKVYKEQGKKWYKYFSQWWKKV